MKTEQAIKHFEDEIRFCERAPAGNPVHQTVDWAMILESNKVALAALREKQERENEKQLTEEELRKVKHDNPILVYTVCLDMDGSPILDDGEWQIFDGDSFVGDGSYDLLRNYGKSFVAFRHKPEDGGAEQ